MIAIRTLYRARYYDPGSGRLLSEDPIGFAGGLNLYRYVHNNAVNFFDPLGWADQYGQQADHSHPPADCHAPNCFWYYGNWGGPGWTGGQWKPYEDLTPDEQAHLAPPIDKQDECYQQHDLCYSRSRVKNKCTARDNPSPKDHYLDDQDTAQCDIDLARCLGKLTNKDAGYNPGALIASPLFRIKWADKKLEANPDAPPRPCAGMNCIDNK